MKPVKDSATRTTAPGKGSRNGSVSKPRPTSEARHDNHARQAAAPQDEHALAATSETNLDAASGNSHSERPERSVHSINGAKGGRPRREVDLDEVRRLLAEGKSVKSTARLLFVGEGTLRRRLGLMYGRRAEDASTPRQKPLGGGS